MKKSTPKTDPKSQITTQSPESVVAALYESAIGIDVHAELLVCAYQISSPTHTIETEIVEFGTKRNDLDAFALWCRSKNPGIIVMESTGVLWRSAYEALERVGFTHKQLALLNARDVKAVHGRKTDKADAKHLAEIARLSVLRKSFVPEVQFRDMRTLSRRYQRIMKSLASQTNIYHKLLNGIGCRAGSVFSSVKGVAASAILEAKIRNDPEFESIVCKQSRRVRATSEEILNALNFEIPESIRQQLLDEYNHIKSLQFFADSTIKRLAELQSPFENQIELLMTIPGIKETAARLIFAELTIDLKEHFSSSEKFCSWMGICPGNNISANKRHSGSSAKGNKWLRKTLVECAHGIGLSKGVLKQRFTVFKMRRGTLRAVVAIAHLLARIIFSVLSRQKAFTLGSMSTRTIQDECVKRIEQNVSQFNRLGNDDISLMLIRKGTGEVIR